MESSYLHLFWGYTAFFVILTIFILSALSSVRRTAAKLEALKQGDTESTSLKIIKNAAQSNRR